MLMRIARRRDQIIILRYESFKCRVERCNLCFDLPQAMTCVSF